MAVQCFMCRCNAGYYLRDDGSMRRICDAPWPPGWSGARIGRIADDPRAVCPWGDHPPISQEPSMVAAKGW